MFQTGAGNDMGASLAAVSHQPEWSSDKGEELLWKEKVDSLSGAAQSGPDGAFLFFMLGDD